MASEFMIGTTLEDLTSLDQLEVPLHDPVSDYSPWFESVELADLTARGLGTPYATWSYGSLTDGERNQLKTFCPGASADVYVRILLDDGTFATFSATMSWPKDPAQIFTLKKQMVFMFTNLISTEAS